MYVGHHYPLDVLGGFALVLIVNYIYRKLVKDKVQVIYFKVEEYLYKYLPKSKKND